MNLLTRIIPEADGKLLFIRQVNTTHYGIKSLRYNGPVIWNDFFRNTDNNKNLCIYTLHKKRSFPLRITPVNCGFGHIYWRNP